MATAISTTLFPDNASNTNLRAWIQFIHDMLSAAGLVQTSDTGQITISTATTPGGANTSVGYEIWRFADTLQGTTPIYLKIEYGSGAAAATPAVWITVGQGSNGSGTLTGQASTRTQVKSTGSNTSNTYQSFGSGAGGSRFSLSMFCNTASALYFCFGVERSKDSAGADTNEGVWVFLYFGSNIVYSQFVPTTGTIPAAEVNARSLLPGSATSSAVGTDVYLYPIYPLNVIPKNPGLNFMAYLNADYTAFTSISAVSAYGSSHVYMPTGIDTGGSGLTGVSGSPVNTAGRLAMRYE